MNDFFSHSQGLKIAVEPGTKLRLEINGIVSPLESRMVGMESDLIIVTAPPNPQGALDHKLFAGNELVVRYLSHGTVYSFQTKIHAVISNPIPLLFLIFPTIVQRDELRSKKRVNCMIPAKITYKQDERPCVIVDLSSNGCRCLVKDPGRGDISFVDIDKPISILCKFPGVKGQAPLYGIVRNLKKSRKEIDIGMMYSKETPVESLKLVSWYISTIESYVVSLG